jgi:hypothetical protein
MTRESDLNSVSSAGIRNFAMVFRLIIDNVLEGIDKSLSKRTTRLIVLGRNGAAATG